MLTSSIHHGKGVGRPADGALHIDTGAEGANLVVAHGRALLRDTTCTRDNRLPSWTNKAEPTVGTRAEAICSLLSADHQNGLADGDVFAGDLSLHKESVVRDVLDRR